MSFRIRLMVWEFDSSESKSKVGLGEGMTVSKGRTMPGLGEGVCLEECMGDS